MSKDIMNVYRESGLPRSDWPKKHGSSGKRGRGIHTKRAHKAAVRYMKQGLSKSEAWKRVQGGMGKHAIKPGHRRTTKNE
jgi:hypothetical protein